MEREIKIDAALTSFSPCSDRFVTEGYRENLSFEKRLEAASKVEGLTGVALDYPTQFKDPVKIRDLLSKFSLRLGMVEIDLFSNPKWKLGSLSSPNKHIRKEAIKTAQEGMDAAVEAKGADVQLWLGQDGYDYPMQVDYDKAWKYLIDGIEEIAKYRRDIKICIEYKFKEPRTHQYISSVGKVLMIVNSLNLDHLGATLDIGHSLMALENPAESAILLNKHGRLFHLHFNDNYRDWDHDMILGSVNLWEMIEFFYWLEKMNFNGWYGIDIYPYREDGFLALTQSIRYIKKFILIAEKLQNSDISQFQNSSDSLKIMEFLMKKIIREPD